MTPLLPIVVIANLTGKDAGTLVPVWVIATAVVLAIALVVVLMVKK